MNLPTEGRTTTASHCGAFWASPKGDVWVCTMAPHEGRTEEFALDPDHEWASPAEHYMERVSRRA